MPAGATSPDSTIPAFLKGGGEMSELTRSYDWSRTSIGMPDKWPQSLRTTVSNLLYSRFPMFLWWGDDLIQFYNDAYRPSLGNKGKHPTALGQRGEECWPEIWPVIFPLIQQVKDTGVPTWQEDQLIPIYRNGELEDVWWTFSYSLVLNDDDTSGGVLVTCMETTRAVLSHRKIEDSEQSLRRTILEAPVAVCIFRGPQFVIETANKKMLEFWGKSSEQVMGKPLFEGIPEAKNQGYEELLGDVLQTGLPFSASELPVILPRNGVPQTVFINFSYQPMREPDGSISAIMATAVDVTAQMMVRQKIEEAKTEAERQRRVYETITASTPDLIYVFDPSYHFTYVNKALLDMWGKTWDESVGKRLLENGYEPWHAEMHEREIDQVVATKTSVRGEVSFPHATLGRRVYDYILVPVFNEQGEVEAIAGTTRDITDLKQAERLVRDSEERLRFALEAGGLGSWEVDLDQFTLRASEHCKANFGQPVDQPFLYSTLQSCIHPDDRQRQEEAVQHTLATGADYDIEYRVIWPDQSLHWLNIRGRLQYGKENKPVRIVGVSIDITQRVLARQAVEESERNLRNMILQSPVAMCIMVGPQFVVTVANDAMLDIWGKPVEQVMNKPILEGLPDVRQQGLDKLMSDVYTTGITYRSNEHPVELFRNGRTEIVYQNFVYEPYKDAKGTIQGVFAISVDVTAQVKARRQIEEVVDERTKALAEANAKLQQSNTELKRSNDNLEEFAHAASHDLKEPVRKIHFFNNQLKGLLGDRLNEKELRSIGRIEHATERMGTLIDDLLIYSHVSQRPHDTETINLNEQIQGVLEDLELDIQEKKAAVMVKELPAVQGYKRQIQQLFQNLITNALKYSKAGVPPQIVISAEAVAENGQDYHLIEVQDNGIGFEQQYAEKIFQMFSRLHGKQEYSGTGVGLSIVKKVVENHNGFIRVESWPEEGATFKVYLPV